MKRIDEMLNTKQKKKAWLSHRTKAKFTEWALEAYKLDPSKPMSHYYEIFVKRLRDKYFESKQKKEFYQNGIIEN